MKAMSIKKYVATGGTLCPCCGSAALTGSEVNIDAGIASQEVCCMQCWANWADTYSLTGYRDLDPSEVTP